MRRPERSLALSQALALGLLQGPTELLPISSSAHTALLSEAAGWGYAELDRGERKSFELALHGGAGLALVVAMRAPLSAQARAASARTALALALALLVPAFAGRLLRSHIERRLGGPRSIAAGLLGGGIAMALADRGAASDGRPCAEAGPLDGLALGLAQALALAPGVSRSGAALGAARARGFGRADAQSLSLAVALPLFVAAGAADGAGLAGTGARPAATGARTVGAGTRTVGAGAAFVSTLLSARVLLRGRWRERPLLPYAAYRALLAAFVLARSRRARRSAR